MPSRSFPFINGEYYHIYNRGVAKMQIYSDAVDYRQFSKSVIYYQIDGQKPRFSFFKTKPVVLDQNKRIIEIISYCFMPNHFHFLLQQKKENGITEFMSKLSNSYTRFFNSKYGRIGPLLQGEFKAVHVGTNEQLIHLSRYIHLNPLIGYVTKELEPDFSLNAYFSSFQA